MSSKENLFIECSQPLIGKLSNILAAVFVVILTRVTLKFRVLVIRVFPRSYQAIAIDPIPTKSKHSNHNLSSLTQTKALRRRSGYTHPYLTHPLLQDKVHKNCLF